MLNFYFLKSLFEVNQTSLIWRPMCHGSAVDKFFAFTVFCLAILCAQPRAYADPCKNFVVIAHRGLSGRAPEESRFAYEMAARLQVDYLEMDLHRTKDGVLIVNHDTDFSRTTNIATVYPKRTKDLINSFTFAEISKLETGTWFNQKFPDFAQPRYLSARILKLEEVIDVAMNEPSRPGLYIETKSPELYPGIEKDLVEFLTTHNAFKNLKVIFQSFDANSLSKFKALKPEIARVYLSEAPYEKLEKELKIAVQVGSGIGADYSEMKKAHLSSFLNRAHASKLAVHLYTVDDRPSLDRLIQVGADGAFTNHADVLVQSCGRMTKALVESKIAL